MRVANFDLPELLVDLVSQGKWPGELGADAAHKLSLDDDHVVLLPPPFGTIGEDIRAGNDFWERDLTNVGEIDYDRAVIIADFGLGSDSPIILYYDTSNPVVMYLKWTIESRTASHAWVKTHASFRAFAGDLGLCPQ